MTGRVFCAASVVETTKQIRVEIRSVVFEQVRLKIAHVAFVKRFRHNGIDVARLVGLELVEIEHNRGRVRRVVFVRVLVVFLVG